MVPTNFNGLICFPPNTVDHVFPKCGIRTSGKKLGYCSEWRQSPLNLEFMAVDVSISVHVGSGICLIALAGVDFTPKTSQEVFPKTSTSYPHLNRLMERAAHSPLPFLLLYLSKQIQAVPQRCPHFCSHSPWDVLGLWKQWRSCVNKPIMNATVFRLWPWGKSFAALNLKPKLSTLVHSLHTALLQTPLRCKSFPTAFYLSHVSQLSFPIAKRKNTEKRPPPLFFTVDDPQSLLILSSVVPCFPPRCWFFISFTSWSVSQIAFIQNSPFSLSQIRFL